MLLVVEELFDFARSSSSGIDKWRCYVTIAVERYEKEHVTHVYQLNMEY
jgi:hypothetical protein